jgi:hypothetical protein
MPTIDLHLVHPAASTRLPVVNVHTGELVMWRRTRNEWPWLAVGSIVGGIGGWLTFLVGERLSTQLLFIIAGVIAGVAIVGLVRVFGRGAQLEQVTVSIPAFGELTIAVTPDGRVVAWKVFVEIVTRITIQPLPERSGHVREALESLRQIFAFTRQTLGAAEPSWSYSGQPTVEELAIAMLNQELRPFLTKWHPQLLAWEKANPRTPESDWPENAACRAELLTTQQRVRRYADEFAKLAKVHNPDVMIGPAAVQPAELHSTTGAETER